MLAQLARLQEVVTKEEEKRQEWQALLDAATREYYTQLNRDIPAKLRSLSTPEMLRNRVLALDRRLLPLRNLLSPAERVQFDKMMSDDAANAVRLFSLSSCLCVYYCAFFLMIGLTYLIRRERRIR